MYPSTTLSWRDDDQLDYDFVENNLHIGKFKNSGAYILLDVSFETVLDEDHSQKIFREMLDFCAKHELTPGLFVNHETIKYNEH